MRVWRLLMAFGLLLVCPAGAELQDPGRTPIANLRVCVIWATDGDPKEGKVQGKKLSGEVEERLRKDERLKFGHYLLLGSDYQPLMRSYESWAEPLKPSDHILVRFSALGKPAPNSAIVDLEMWMGKRKIIKTDARLEEDKPLILLGPDWRDGRLVVFVRLYDPSAVDPQTP